jgi:DNA-binding GntR family transcriptional regulator
MSQRTLSTETVYRGVKNWILDNTFPPGFQILEQDLAALFMVSRTPVREALVRLESDGLVDVVPRHGMRVLPLKLSDMKEIYEILSSPEPKAAELVAQRRLGPSALEPLDRAAGDMATALERDDLDAWADADARFHLTLIGLCGNRRLATMVLNCWDQVHRARSMTLRLRPKPVDSTREHLAIVAAIKAGEAAEAYNLYRQHRERVGNAMIEVLRRHRLANI